MTEAIALEGRVVPFPQTKKAKSRKVGVNKNRKGSVRSINGKLYVDFPYLGERVREKTGLIDNRDNVKTVRGMLDRISVAIETGTFKFAEVFPYSKRKEYFKGKEAELAGSKKTPDQLLFKDYVWVWYNLLKGSGRVSPRTLFGYKIYLNSYLIPFFGNMTFDDLSSSIFEKFIVWARKRKLKGRQICTRSTNKIFVPLKMICNSAMNEYRWAGYNPFFGFRKLPEDDAYEKIMPFNLEEQKAIIDNLPEHWKPYFLCAFCIGLRQGEEIGLKPDDIDWQKGLLHIRRGITTDENGEMMEGPTKNKYSRRTIKLNSIMIKALSAQKVIYDKFKGEYFFCSPEGQMVHRPNLYRRAWLPALKKANIPIRDMKQTRHSFATVALSKGENPLWIAKVMGHRDTSMIIRVYSKYVENICGTNDGSMIDAAYQELAIGN